MPAKITGFVLVGRGDMARGEKRVLDSGETIYIRGKFVVRALRIRLLSVCL